MPIYYIAYALICHVKYAKFKLVILKSFIPS